MSAVSKYSFEVVKYDSDGRPTIGAFVNVWLRHELYFDEELRLMYAREIAAYHDCKKDNFVINEEPEEIYDIVDENEITDNAVLECLREPHGISVFWYET